jgi:hypothetical protein
MPLLEAIHFFIKFVRPRDMFVCDFIATTKICDRVMYHMCCDNQCCFQCDMFINFLALVNYIHENNYFRWIKNMNTRIDHLAFEFAR